ncbi:MAG: CHAT domain-containing protein [Cyclobacteriaceae bacterium]
MKKIFFFVFFLVSLSKSYSQDLQVLLDSSTYYWDHKQYTQAFSTLNKAVEVAKSAYEAEEENAAYNYAYILNQVGMRLYTGENYETAATYYNVAIPIFEKVQGENGQDYIACVENLALSYEVNSQFEEALNVFAYLLENEAYQNAAGSNIFQTYNKAAICAYQQDNYELAKEFYEKALSYLNEESPSYWVILENLIVLERDFSQYAEGYKYLEKLLKKFPEKKSEYRNLIAYYHRDLGNAEFNEGNYNGAVLHLKTMLEYLVEEDSIDRISRVYALEGLSLAYVNSQNYTESIPFLIENEKSTKAHYGEKSDAYIYSLNYLTLAFTELADYRNTNGTYKKAFRIIEKLSGQRKGEMQSLFDSNYSDYLMKVGKYSESETYAQRALSFYESNKKLYFDDVIKSMNQIGVLLATMGEYDKAEALFKQALNLHQNKHGLENDVATTIVSNMTGLYIQTGRGFRASQLIDFVLANDLKLHGENSYEYSFSLQVAGVLLTSSGDHKKAIQYLSKSYEIRKPLVSEDNRDFLRLKQSLGSAYLKGRQYDKAESILKEVLTSQKKSLGTNNFDLSLTQNDLGMVLLAKKDYNGAEKLFDQSYESKNKILGPYNQFTITSLYNLACTNLQNGNQDKSLEYFKRSMSDYFHVLDEYFPYLSEKERLEYYNTIKGQLGAYFSFLTGELDQHPEYAGELYNTHVKTKSMLLNESMKLRNSLINHSDPNVQQVYKKWTYINEEIAKLEQYNNEGSKRVYLDSLKIVGEEYERYLNALPKISTDNTEVTWNDVAATLKDGEVAVEIIRVKHFNFEKNAIEKENIDYLALIIDNKTTDFPKYVKLEEGFLMDSKYFNVYKNNMKYKLEDKLSYGYFWKPIAEKLSTYNKIYISSDGAYHLLNLNTLYNPNTLNFVINESNIEIVGNTKELLDRQSSNEKPNDAILFGFPNFNTQADTSSTDEQRSSVYRDIFSSGVSDLPGTKTEIANINALMASSGVDSKSFISEAAHEGQLKGIASADIVHIATHGFFEESTDDVLNDDPLTHSGLLLANIKEAAGMEEENGIITAKEIAQLNLLDNKLVVLSACETGKGKVVDGEGVYGLQRAFQVAGAANVIISLWKVDDTATQQLMTYFYEDYLLSNDPRIALRQAQMKLQEDFPHPNYWGAFYVVGK